jgi:hypothetical protein
MASSFGKMPTTAHAGVVAHVISGTTPHRDMPDFIIPAKDKADVVAYILSLQK